MHNKLLNHSIMEVNIRPTQDGHYNVIFEDLDGATGDKVESSKHVPAVD